MSSADAPKLTDHHAPVGLSLARGVLGGWLLVAAQVLFLLTLERDRLSGVWEAQSGVIGLLPAWLLVAALPGALGGHLARIVEQFARGKTAARWSASALFFALAALIAWGVGGGRHLASYSIRSGFAVCVGCVAGALVFWALPWLTRLVHEGGSPARRASWTLGATILVCVALEIANHWLLVRLYPGFHAGLSGLAVLVAGWGWATWSSLTDPVVQRRPRLLKLSTVAALLLSAVLLIPASRFVRGFDNFRWLVGESSPSLSLGLEISSRLAPPPELDPTLASVPLGKRRSQGAVDLRGRDILLISIDALRADHVGAYGYERPTTPAIDALAESGVVFQAAYAPTPHTSYSVVSLMTGKYMRPLLLQGAGGDSDLWAQLLQAYGYRTAAFYPPAVFFIDAERFDRFQKTELGFEYAKVEFAEGDLRVSQYRDYLEKTDASRRVFTWVHLFGPHEPYEAHPEYDFGKRDVDLYDAEIRAADETVGRLVEAARERDPKAVVIVTADHGEEFGDHGGRYHGTSVYDEQVRVPLVVDIPDVTDGARVQEPVQTIDLLPTVLSGLSIPIPPRIRGRDLTALVSSGKERGAGRAVSETDEYTLLAQGPHRLICGRRSGACRLYDISEDPGQLEDISRDKPEVLTSMRDTARSLAETHGKYESQGLRAEGKGWPAPILRGISGDADVAPDLALLLDDADRAIRAKAAELLFDVATTGQAPALRLAITREEDFDARAWIALTLTRLGQGAPLVFELLSGADLRYRRYAALALAEAGHDDGEDELIRWWAARKGMDHELALRLLRAFANIRSRKAVGILVSSLEDVRLRPHIARTLGQIGDKDARPFLAAQLLKERYRSARLPLARAIVQLGGDDELIVPLRRFLGVPERLEGGIGLAVEAGVLDDVGGPKEPERRRLEQLSDSGIRLSVVVPPGPKESSVRLIFRARSKSGRGGEILLEPGRARVISKDDGVRARNQPEIATKDAIRLPVPGTPRETDAKPADPQFVEVAVTLPERFDAKPGHYLGLEIFAPQDIEITALAAVPEQSDLPPPPPEPWENPKRHPQSAPDSSELKEAHSP